MLRIVWNVVAAAFLIGVVMTSQAVINGHLYTFDDEEKTALFKRLAFELRCPKCQNQNLTDSNSEVAEDLRRQLYEMVKAGNTEQEIKTFMVDRYGDFVLYKPKVDKTTWVLWYSPYVLVIFGVLIVMGIVFMQRSRNKATPVEQKNTLSEQQKKRLDDLLNNDQDEGDSK